MFIDNNWYGNRFILSKYLKIKDKSFFASIQHGYLFFNKNTFYKKRKISLAPWLVWNQFIAKKLKKDGHKNIIVIGAPFLYLHKLLKSKKEKEKCRGTLIIPSKSAYEINMVVDYDKLFQFVKKKFPGPFTIMVGYQDLKRVAMIRNKYKNLRFITCGKRKNKFFTFNLYNYINKHKNVLHFYIGSPLFYSIFLKKKTYYFNNRFVKSLSGKGVKFGDNKEINLLKKEDLEIVNKVKDEVNLDFNDLNTLANYKKAKLALGYNHMMNRKKLYKILDFNSNLKSFFSVFISFIFKLKYFDFFWKKY